MAENPALDINGNTTTTFTSGTNGVYFIDTLPYGDYYLYEVTAEKWFTLTVSGDTADGSRDGVVIKKTA